MPEETGTGRGPTPSEIISAIAQTARDANAPAGKTAQAEIKALEERLAAAAERDALSAELQAAQAEIRKLADELDALKASAGKTRR